MSELGSQDSVRPLGLLFLIVMSVLMWTGKRERALVPLLITTCYMPMGQTFVMAGLNFQLFRMLLMVGWARVLTRGENKDFVFTRMDKLFVYWVLVSLFVGTLAEPTFDRFINRGGEAYNAMGTYFLIRCWVRRLDDVIGMVRFLSVMIIPLAVTVIIEKSTTHNIFSIFGGVPEITSVREGKLRCQGAFRHPILTGTYAATLFPMFIGLWTQGKKDRWRSVAGLISALVVTVAASSSGALMAIMCATIGLVMWKMRYKMQLFRRVMVAMILVLALTMKAPVWYLIAKIGDLTGGTGWHRSYLIDVAIRHLNEWWLVGSTYTAHWAPAGQVLGVDAKNMDITNNYIAEGLGGGFLKLGLFLAMITLGYKTVGRWVKHPIGVALPDRIMVWSLGASLCAHCVSFISITYFDQIIVMWYFMLAIFAMLLQTFPTSIRNVPEPIQETKGNGGDRPIAAAQ